MRARLGRSPFQHHGPLAPRDVQGRDELLADLAERVTSRRVTALLGPRRYGKTSVLGRLAADLTEVQTILVDCFGVADYADLAARIAAATRAVPAIHQQVTSHAVSAGVNLGVLQASVTRTGPEPTEKGSFIALIDAVLAAARSTPVCLVIDEFQSINDVPGAAAQLRTQLQHSYTEIGLVFAGSAPSAMRDIFSRHDQPFYNQADLVLIEPLTDAAVHDIVTSGFLSTGDDPGTVSGRVWALARGHPQRTMQLADAVWQRVDGPAEQSWPTGIDAVRAAEDPRLAATYADYSTSEQRVLRLLANHQPVFGRLAEQLGLSNGAAAHARRTLLADGKLVDQNDGDPIVTDPLLEDWMRRRLPL